MNNLEQLIYGYMNTLEHVIALPLPKHTYLSDVIATITLCKQLPTSLTIPQLSSFQVRI
jgi:hypothetical protein